MAGFGFDTSHAFSRKEEVRQVDHLVCAAAGWGGLPWGAATYMLDSVDENGGETPHALTVKDVPVERAALRRDGFADRLGDDRISRPVYEAVADRIREAPVVSWRAG